MLDHDLTSLRAEVARRREDLRIARKHEEEAAARTGTPENVAAWRRARAWTRDRAEAEREARSRLIRATAASDVDDQGRPFGDVRDVEPVACAECGHLHWLGADLGYGVCPIEGCDCLGRDDR